MTRFSPAILLFLCAKLLCPPAYAGGTSTRDLQIFPPGYPRQLRLAPDTSFVVCASSPGEVAVIDESRGKVLASFSSPDEVFAVAPNGRAIAAASGPSSVTLYAPPAWAAGTKLEAASPRMMEFSADGQFFAIGNSVDRIYIYQLPAWERIYTLITGSDNDEELNDMSFSPDSRFFAAVTGGVTGTVWETVKWRKTGNFKARGASANFTYDGKFLSAPPAVYEMLPGKVKKSKLPEGGERFTAAKFLRSKNLLVTLENGSLHFFDEATRAAAGELVSYPGAVSEYAISSDSNFLVVASTTSGTLYLTALEEVAGLLSEGAALYAAGKYDEALAKFQAAQARQDTQEISEKVADAGYRACEARSDAAAAAKQYETAVTEMRAALVFKPGKQGEAKLRGLTRKLGSLKFSDLVAKAGELESKYEYGAAADVLKEALKVKRDAKTAEHLKKLVKQEPAAAKYRKEFALGAKALKKQDYAAAVEIFTKTIKIMDTPEARKGLEEAQNNYRR